MMTEEHFAVGHVLDYPLIYSRFIRVDRHFHRVSASTGVVLSRDLWAGNGIK